MATIEHKIKIPVAFNLSEPMVQINKKTTYSNGGSRTHRQYELSHLLDTEGKKPRVDGVTSIISSQLTAPGLDYWKQDWIRRGLSGHKGELTSGSIDEIMSASDKEAQTSMEIGNDLHKIISGLLTDSNPYPSVSDQLRPAVTAFLRWRNQYSDWKCVGSEVGIYNYEPAIDIGYAGTIDAVFARGSELMIVDWKTSSGLYDSNYMQLGAYAYALQRLVQEYTANAPSSNGNSHKIPFNNVDARAIRFVNAYPLDDNGKKDRSKAKIFEDQVEESESIDVSFWMDAFLSCYHLRDARKSKVKTHLI